jgi:hypothetical protein
MLVAWNLLPQPKWIHGLYKKAYEKIQVWLSTMAVLVLVSSGGCHYLTRPVQVDGHAKERAMAEIAIASVTAGQTPTVVVPKVGDKCPVCNDPPGACGVGKTGDGRTCDTCGTCNGDGRIDESDLSSEAEEAPVVVPPEEEAEPEEEESVIEVQKEIAVHVPYRQRNGWGTRWYANDRKTFEDRGWEVRLILESDASTQSTYYDVIAPDGEVFPFFSPLEVKDIEHLETR